MRNPFDDDARTIILAAIDDDDITPIEGVARPPRGSARRGSVVVALDEVSGEYVASNKPTPDPWDLAIRRPKWAGTFRVVREDE